MNQERLSNIKSEDKKALGKFILFTVCSGIAGAGIGICLLFFQKVGADEFAGVLNQIMNIFIPYGILIVTAVVVLINTVIYQRSKKAYLSWDGEEEETINKVEGILSYAIWLSSLNMIINFFLFAVGTGSGMIERSKTADTFWDVIILVVGLMVGLVAITMQQQKIVNLEKQINPEKNGSIFDMKFKKKWEESCDEAEKFKMYQCGFKAYNTTAKVCMVLWVICSLSGMVWDIGIFPVFIVSVIWGTLITSYCMEELRSNKKS